MVISIFVVLKFPSSSVGEDTAEGNGIPVIVVVGTGMAGLGCARHLEHIFRQYGERCKAILWRKNRELVVEYIHVLCSVLG